MNKVRIVAGGVAIVLASAGVMHQLDRLEGDHLIPYRDTGGIWTVCKGVTKNVVPGRKYTQAECDAMSSKAFAEHGAAMLRCTPSAEWTQQRYDAMALLAYNVGYGALCGSCLSKGNECIGDLIRANKWPEACNRITAYGKVRIDGVLRDCSDRKWQCYGVYLRRKQEADWCNGVTPPITSLGATG